MNWEQWNLFLNYKNCEQFPQDESLADPGEVRGCSTNTFVTNSVSQPFPPTALWRSHAQTGKDSSSSYKIDYVIVIKKFLDPKGHQNPVSCSKVTAILLKGLILSIGGVASGRFCACSLHSRLFFYHSLILSIVRYDARLH